MKIDFINLKRQYRLYKAEIDQRIEAVLESAVYIGGETIRSFETDMSTFVGVKNAIGCSSGTDALILALMAMEIQPGDEVIVPTFSFIATAEVVVLLGAKPVFVDIDIDTFNTSAEKIEEKITQNTKAFMPVSLFGQTADMEAINELAQRYSAKIGHKIYVVEDAAQSFGAMYKGRRSCNLSDLACTSFFPAKPLGGYGDGGALFTDDDELAKQIRIILNHGQTENYTHTKIGINGRLDAIQAAVLSVKLKHYDAEISKRKMIAKEYHEGLKNLVLPLVREGCESVWSQYCIRTDNRKAFQTKCETFGVPTRIYYPTPLHLQEVFRYLGYCPGDFPIAEKVAHEILALPMYAFLSQEEQSYMLEVING